MVEKKFGICIVVILSPWQMASDKTTPTASGIGARFPLGAEGEAGGEGSETHLPAPPDRGGYWARATWAVSRDVAQNVYIYREREF
jgi:hypothetical protein